MENTIRYIGMKSEQMPEFFHSAHRYLSHFPVLDKICMFLDVILLYTDEREGRETKKDKGREIVSSKKSESLFSV